MDPSDLIIKLLSDGGVVGTALAVMLVLASPGWAAWFWERRRSAQREDKLLELATAQVQAMTHHDALIDANTKVLEHLEQRVDQLR